MNVIFVYRCIAKSESFENRVNNDFNTKVGKLSLSVKDIKIEASSEGEGYIVTICSYISGTTISVSKRHESVVGAYELAFDVYLRQLNKFKTRFDKLRREKSHSKQVLTHSEVISDGLLAEQLESNMS